MCLGKWSWGRLDLIPLEEWWGCHKIFWLAVERWPSLGDGLVSGSPEWTKGKVAGLGCSVWIGKAPW
jgi:hypothetical protein